jgi:hypothetical protein
MKRAHNPFVAVKKWRALDYHTGIGKDAGVPYTYEHVAAAPAAGATVYRVETYIPFEQPTPLHRDVYYVPRESSTSSSTVGASMQRSLSTCGRSPWRRRSRSCAPSVALSRPPGDCSAVPLARKAATLIVCLAIAVAAFGWIVP